MSKLDRHVREARAVAERLDPFEADAVKRVCKSAVHARGTCVSMAREVIRLRDALRRVAGVTSDGAAGTAAVAAHDIAMQALAAQVSGGGAGSE